MRSPTRGINLSKFVHAIGELEDETAQTVDAAGETP
jgi:hypothetical protein